MKSKQLKFMAVLVTLVMVLSATVCFAESERPVVKFGAIFALSGSGADNGIQNKEGIELAVEYINANGGIEALGADIEVVFYDNMSDVNQCKAVAERLIAENPDVVAVTGSGGSSYVIPVLPVFEKEGIPFITAQTAESITNQGYQYAFQNSGQGGDFAYAQITFLDWLNTTYDLGLTKIGVIYEDTEWGINTTNGLLRHIESYPELEVVYNQSFPAGFSDASTVIMGLMNSGADVVFPTCYTQDAKLVFNTMQSLKYSPVIIGGGGGFLYPTFATELGDLVDGIVSVASHSWDIAPILEDPLYKNIAADFEAKYGEFPGSQAIASLDCIRILVQAVNDAASTDRDAVRDAIRAVNMTSFTPGAQPANFNEAGWNEGTYCLIVQWKQREDGVYVTQSVYPKPISTADFVLPEAMQSK